MSLLRGTMFRVLAILVLVLAALGAYAQGGNAGTVRGTVTDHTGAVVPNATVHLTNQVSGLDRSGTTNATGQFGVLNIPFNPYQVTVSATGFAKLTQSFEIRSVIGTNLKLVLQVGAASSTVTVEASGDLIETDSTFHTDVDRDLFIKVPLESQSSSLSSLVTLTTPGVAADSNGLFHGLGDHASNSFSVDGQAITDQQSKVFSNQLPSNSIPIDRGDLGRPAGGVRGQNQPSHQGHYALRPGCDDAHRQRNCVVWIVWFGDRRI